jgi:hypothetical protein
MKVGEVHIDAIDKAAVAILLQTVKREQEKK